MAQHPGSSAALQDVPHGGMVREDVMNRIFDLSNYPLPYTNLVGSGSADNSYHEWTTDKLADPALSGWVVDGSDSDQNDVAHGLRLGNHCGILRKEVRVTTRAQNVDTIGYSNALSHQIERRQIELRRNVEANLLHTQGSQADNGDATPGIPAGLAAMLTQFDTGSGAAGGGFANGQWTAVTPGTAVGLTETMVRDACQAAYEDGANPSVLMSVPSVIRLLSEYMFDNSARIATLTGETNQQGPATGMGTVNAFMTDFDVMLRFVPNRIQQAYAAGTTAAAVFLLDPSYLEVTMLHGYRVEPLAKTGLSEKRMMAVDFTQTVTNLDSGRVLLDIDVATPVVQA